MGFLAIFGTSMIAWVILAFVVMKWNLLNKIVPLKLSKSMTLWGLIIIGLVVTGTGAGIFESVTGAEASIGGLTGATSGADLTGEIECVVSKTVETNTSASDGDYINDEEDITTLYLTDEEIADTNTIIFNATCKRKLISEDAIFEITCEALDKPLAGETDKKLVTVSSGQLQLTIEGGGSKSADSVTEDVALSEGTNSVVIDISVQQDESYQDSMVDMDDYYDIVCTVASGSQSDTFKLRTYANS